MTFILGFFKLVGQKRTHQHTELIQTSIEQLRNKQIFTEHFNIKLQFCFFFGGLFNYTNYKHTFSSWMIDGLFFWWYNEKYKLFERDCSITEEEREESRSENRFRNRSVLSSFGGVIIVLISFSVLQCRAEYGVNPYSSRLPTLPN